MSGKVVIMFFIVLIGNILGAYNIKNTVANEITNKKILPVPYFYQGLTGWCFFNSLAMVMQYYGKSIHPWDIAAYWNAGHDEGLPPPLLESTILDWLNWDKLSKYLSNYGLDADWSNIISWDYIESHINNNEPVLFLGQPLFKEGHAVVIVGYSKESDKKYLYIHDPSGYFIQDIWGISDSRPFMYSKIPEDKIWPAIKWTQAYLVSVFGGTPNPPEGVIYLTDSDIQHRVEGNWESYNDGSIYLSNRPTWISNPELYIGGYLKPSVYISNQYEETKTYQINIEILKNNGVQLYSDSKIINVEGHSEVKFTFDKIPNCVLESGKLYLYFSLWKPNPDYSNLEDRYDIIGPFSLNMSTEYAEEVKKIFDDVKITPASGWVGDWTMDIECIFYAYLHEYKNDWSFSLYVDPRMVTNERVLYQDTGKTPLYFKVKIFDDGNNLLYETPNWISTDTDGDGIYGDISHLGGYIPNIYDPITITYDEMPSFLLIKTSWKLDYGILQQYAHDIESIRLYLTHKPKFHIDIEHEMLYSPGSDIQVTIIVKNVGSAPGKFKLGCSFRHADGSNLFHANNVNPSSWVSLDVGESQVFKVSAHIPSDAKNGRYQIASDCWWDPYNDDHYYIDDLDWKDAFYVGQPLINIIFPTTNNKIEVGSYDKPLRMFTIKAKVIDVNTGNPIKELEKNSFRVYIGSKTAKILSCKFDYKLNQYHLTILTPTQNQPGNYDITLMLMAGEQIIAIDTKNEAVNYTSAQGISKVDIIFVFDDTGSMSDEIDVMKTKSIEFAEALENTGINYRLGLVTFKDYVNIWNGGELTNDKSEFEGWINSLYADGGGDTPEDQFDALVAAATEINFRSGVQKIFVLITDAPSHFKGDGSGVSEYTQEEVINILQENEVITFIIAIDNTQYNGEGSISAETNGEFYDIHGDIDFTDIIDKIIGFTHKTIEEVVLSVVGKISRGESILHTAIIDAASLLATFSSEIEGSELGFTLLDPYGRIINESVAEKDPYINYTEIGNYKAYTIKDITPGLWILNITGKDVDENETYSLLVTTVSELTIMAKTNKNKYNLTEPVKIVVAVVNNMNISLSAYIMADVITPSGEHYYLQLFDDGLHGDEEANDGVFSNYFTNSTLPGIYNINVTATGFFDNKPFVRKKQITITVLENSPPPAIIWDKKIYNITVQQGGKNNTMIFLHAITDITGKIFLSDFVNDSGKTIPSDCLTTDQNIIFINDGENKTITLTVNMPSSISPGTYRGYLFIEAANIFQIPIHIIVKEFEVNIKPAIIAETVLAGSSLTKCIYINISGYGELNNLKSFVVGEINNWTTIDFSESSISQNSSTKLNITFTPPENIESKIYDGNIYITSNNFMIPNLWVKIKVNKRPVANFSYSPKYPKINQNITFDGSLSFDPDGAIVSWLWDFGDGSISYDQNPQHQYPDYGIYTVVLTVTDEDGATDSYKVNITVQPINYSPVITITYPSNGSIVSSNITIQGKASDEDGNETIQKVEIKIDNGDWKIATGTTLWSYEWNTNQVENGEHIIYARAFDGENYSDIVSINVNVFNNHKPFVKIIEPENGSIVKGTIVIKGKAWDIDGNETLQKVEVRIDGGKWKEANVILLNWAYTLDTKKLENGNHTIYARAYDGKDYSNIVSIYIEVKNKKGVAGFELTVFLAAVVAVAWIRKRKKL